jgi:hypothetical protein
MTMELPSQADDREAKILAFVDSFASTLERLDGDCLSEPYERAQSLSNLWQSVSDANLSESAALQPIRFELLAWQFRSVRPGFGRHPPSRWAPIFEHADGSKFPDPDRIENKEFFLDYLRERLSTCQSVVHKARYADLLWEFAHDHQDARIAIDAYLASATSRASGAKTTPIAALIACARTTTTIQTGSPSGRIDTGLTTWPTFATARPVIGK